MPPRWGASLPRDRNNLLADLSPKSRRAFVDCCELVDLTFGEVLAEPDTPLRHVYFPLTAFISILVPAGASELEVGLIGREGMLGATALLGIDLAPLHGLVQGTGSALRMTTARFRSEVGTRPVLRAKLLRYCYIVYRQLAQTAACTHYHSVETRLARWLLMTQDRAGDASMQLTQEFLARMLGVRRVGVTHAAGALQARRLIGYQRGKVVVRNRRGLEAAACACYAEDRRLYERSLEEVDSGARPSARRSHGRKKVVPIDARVMQTCVPDIAGTAGRPRRDAATSHYLLGLSRRGEPA